MVAALHPNIWALHGRRQVLAWLADHMAAGLGVVPPQEGWRAALVGADVVIGDHGSVTRYGAALGVPVLMNGVPAGRARRLDRPRFCGACARRSTPADLDDQLTARRRRHRRTSYAELAGKVSSCPASRGRSCGRRCTGCWTCPSRPSVPVSPVPLPSLSTFRTVVGGSLVTAGRDRSDPNTASSRTPGVDLVTSGDGNCR